jgi:hypothetical protein
VGLWHRLPVSIDPPTGPQRRSLGCRKASDQRTIGTLRGLPGSLRQPSRHGLPALPVEVPVARSFHWCGPGVTGRTGGTGSSASPCVGGSPPRPAFHRFTHVQVCGFVSAPSAPRVTPTHWASTTELQRPKLGKDLHLLAGGAARRTTRNCPGHRPGQSELLQAG